MRRTEQQKIPMSIRVPQQTHRKLMQLAYDRGMTPSGCAQKAVEEYVNNPPAAECEEVTK